MRTSSQRPLPTTISALAGLALVLSACGGDDSDAAEDSTGGTDNEQVAEEQAANVYQFDQAKVADGDDAESFYPPAGEPVTVHLSNELAALVPEDNPVAVHSFALTARSFETGICALDVEVEYEDGGLEALHAYYESDPGGDSESRGDPQERIGSKLVGSSADQVVGSLPEDDQLEQGQVYVTEDGTGFTVVEECSADEENNLAVLGFPHTDLDFLNDSRPSSHQFAEVEVVVHSDGSIVLNEPNVRGAEVSASGDWIAAD